MAIATRCPICGHRTKDFVPGGTRVVCPACRSKYEQPYPLGEPELRQFRAFAPADFQKYPVWVRVHTLDGGERWYEGTDEETYRPWTGPLPVDPEFAMFLARSAFTLADGRTCDGFVTLVCTGRGNDLCATQPYLFLASEKLCGFWHGMFKYPPYVQALYDEFGDDAKAIFPIRFTIEAALTTGVSKGRIIGFCRLRGGEVKEYFGRQRQPLS